MNKVFLHRRVVKFLDEIEEKRRKKLLYVIKALEKFPLIRADIKKIGQKTYRLRVGDIRIIFDYSKQEKRVFVKYVDFRGRVYKF